jgi:hypothetical protein
MNSKKRTSTPKSVVILQGLDAAGSLVAEEHVSLFDYYEQLHAILDEDVTLRLKKGIRRVVGQIYNKNGELDQEFGNDYDDTGTIVRSRIVFSDGTVSEKKYVLPV